MVVTRRRRHVRRFPSDRRSFHRRARFEAPTPRGCNVEPSSSVALIRARTPGADVTTAGTTTRMATTASCDLRGRSRAPHSGASLSRGSEGRERRGGGERPALDGGSPRRASPRKTACGSSAAMGAGVHDARGTAIGGADVPCAQPAARTMAAKVKRTLHGVPPFDFAMTMPRGALAPKAARRRRADVRAEKLTRRGKDAVRIQASCNGRDRLAGSWDRPRCSRTPHRGGALRGGLEAQELVMSSSLNALRDEVISSTFSSLSSRERPSIAGTPLARRVPGRERSR